MLNKLLLKLNEVLRKGINIHCMYVCDGMLPVLKCVGLNWRFGFRIVLSEDFVDVRQFTVAKLSIQHKQTSCSKNNCLLLA